MSNKSNLLTEDNVLTVDNINQTIAKMSRPSFSNVSYQSGNNDDEISPVEEVNQKYPNGIPMVITFNINPDNEDSLSDLSDKDYEEETNPYKLKEPAKDCAEETEIRHQEDSNQKLSEQKISSAEIDKTEDLRDRAPNIKVILGRVIIGSYYLRIPSERIVENRELFCISPREGIVNSSEFSFSIVTPDRNFNYNLGLHNILCDSLIKTNTELNHSEKSLLNNDELGFIIIAAIKFHGLNKKLFTDLYSKISERTSFKTNCDPEELYEKAKLLSTKFKECTGEHNLYTGNRMASKLDMTLGRLHPEFAHIFLGDKFNTVYAESGLMRDIIGPKKSIKKPQASQLANNTQKTQATPDL